MSPVQSDEKKICPKCKQSDVTSFSSCRNCGTKYDLAPQVKHKEASLGLPLFLGIIVLLVGVCGYQYLQMQGTYTHPDKLVGKIMRSQERYVLVATSADFLFKYNAEAAKAAKNDPKRYGSKGIGGIMSAASAINSMAAAMDGADTGYSLLFRYIQSGQMALVSSGSSSGVSLVVLDAKTNATNSIVQVRIASGPKAGGVFWMNSSDLDLVTK